MRAFSGCGEQGLHFIAVSKLLLWSTQALERGLSSWQCLVSAQHVGILRAEVEPRVPCIGGQILNH